VRKTKTKEAVSKGQLFLFPLVLIEFSKLIFQNLIFETDFIDRRDRVISAADASGRTAIGCRR